jgi:hypothetical protein
MQIRSKYFELLYAERQGESNRRTLQLFVANVPEIPRSNNTKVCGDGILSKTMANSFGIIHRPNFYLKRHTISNTPIRT